MARADAVVLPFFLFCVFCWRATRGANHVATAHPHPLGGSVNWLQPAAARAVVYHIAGPSMTWTIKLCKAKDGSGHVAVCTMATSRANQINKAFLDDLDVALDSISRMKPAPRGVVLTSTGRVFSAGLDLKENFNTREYTRAFIQRYEACMRRVMTFPLPTVAALNGHVRAAGFRTGAMPCAPALT